MPYINASLYFLCFMLIFSGCDSGVSEDGGIGTNPEIESIAAFISNLNYDPDELLNVQPSDESREPTDEAETVDLIR